MASAGDITDGNDLRPWGKTIDAFKRERGTIDGEMAQTRSIGDVLKFPQRLAKGYLPRYASGPFDRWHGMQHVPI
ncbi:hypothetical protein TNIN_151071 [Trichonephila inaurata madagascariensis]|uniref:Uncharacterized protein n=1 Tax=Trichonephila inaurata madagascariensis TaxID=2747483 RepID=A0A8X6Y1C2_9ARAC|nr:hypothetical protein TNIN_151071 [Trichonephila inaurata madagascariensis]